MNAIFDSLQACNVVTIIMKQVLSPDFQIADVTLSLFFRENDFKDDLSSKDWIQMGLRSAWNADQKIPITIWFYYEISFRLD